MAKLLQDPLEKKCPERLATILLLFPVGSEADWKLDGTMVIKGKVTSSSLCI